MLQTTAEGLNPPQREPWSVLIPLSLAGSFLIGGMLASLTVYTASMQPAFEWSETALGVGPVALLLGMSIANLGVGAVMPLLGARAVFAAGCFLAGAGWIAAGSVAGLWQFTAAMAVAGIGVGAATIVPGIAVISELFHARRGLAIALFIGSCALASAVMPMATGRVIDAAGWRDAFRMVGGLALVLTLLLLRLLPQRLPMAAEIKATGSPNLPGVWAHQALRIPSFWLLVVVLTISQLCMNGVLFNTVPFLQKSGFTPDKAVGLYSVTNFMSLPGLLIGGFLSDRIPARRLLPAILAMQATGTFALLGVHSDNPGALVAMTGFVVLWGGVAGLPAQSGALLLGDIVGQRSFAGLLGVMFTINGFVGALAPGLTGWLHDASGSYLLPFGLFSGVLMVAALACIGCRTRHPDAPAL